MSPISARWVDVSSNSTHRQTTDLRGILSLLQFTKPTVAKALLSDIYKAESLSLTAASSKMTLSEQPKAPDSIAAPQPAKLPAATATQPRPSEPMGMIPVYHNRYCPLPDRLTNLHQIPSGRMLRRR